MKVIPTIFLLIALLGGTYAQNPLPSPENLQATVEDNNVILTWQEPDTSNSFYLSWDNGITGNAVGYTSGGTFAVAARWDTAMISPYTGYEITKLSFYLPGVNTTYNIRIWEGPNADTVSYVMNNVSGNPNDWTTIYLENPVSINTDQNLWVGYEMIQPEGDFPAGCDFGPAVVNYGDMVNFDGTWQSMSTTFGLDFNFNIRVYISDDSKSSILAQPSTPSEFPYSNVQTTNTFSNYVYEPQNLKLVENLLGYNVYRDNLLLNSAPLSDTTFQEVNLDNGVYNYGVTAVYENGESNPALINVQVGNPEMVIDPDHIIDTLPVGANQSYVLTIYNQGNLELNWLGLSNVAWLSVFPPTGNLAPGEGIDVTANVGTYGLPAGTYNGSIIFFQNNPENPTDTIPFSITVSGDPYIVVQPNELNFGDVLYQSNPSKSLTIYNNGAETLTLSEFSSDNPAFQILNGIDSIAPYNQATTMIEFDAGSLGENIGSLTISSNDPINPQINIPMTAFVYLPGPVSLQAEIDSNNVYLEWAMTVGGEGDWLHWDDGENYNAIGLTGGGTFRYAARWEPAQIAGYDGNAITKIAFFPRGANTQYTAKIWTGPDASIQLASQDVNNFSVDTWNEVYLQNPVTLDASQELWVGFEVNQPEGDFPAGSDIGPAVQQYGDMVNLDGTWASISSLYGLDMNWNIQVFISTADSTNKSVKPDKLEAETPLPANSGKLVTLNQLPSQNPVFAPFSPTSEVLGYNVYRDDSQINTGLLSETSYVDTNVPQGIYEYGVTAVYAEGESPQTQITVQTGAPELLLNPTAITDTAAGPEAITYEVSLINEGDIDLVWTGTPNTNWISISPESGTVSPGDSSNFTLTINPSGLFSGTYFGAVVFEYNNLNNPVETLPVSLTVNGEAQLIFIQDSINFGITAVGTTKTTYATISNVGNEFVFVSGMEANPNVFQTESFPVYLGPGGTISFPVYFTPETLGNFNGTLTVSTDSTLNLSISLPLAGTSLLPQPLNFTAVVDSNTVNLDWQNPNAGDNTLQYSEEQSSTAIGYSTGGTFNTAAKFGPSELMVYNGGLITQVGFYPWTANADFTLKIWLGENAETLVTSQVVPSVNPNEWNDITLDTPIPIDTASFIWIGYEVTHEEGEFPAGVDFGPAVTGFGDLISIDGLTWETLTNYGLPYNWNIRGFISLDDKKSGIANLQPLSKEIYSNTGTLVQVFKPNSKNMEQTLVNPVLLGYNLYRDGIVVNDSLLLTESAYSDFNLETGTYTYEVTAVYESGESLPAGPLEVIIEDPALFPQGWTPTPTAMTHVIYIPTASENTGFMSPGDWIGVFYNDNGVLKPGGALYWNDSDSLKLIAYGDDPNTPQKEGFTLGEWFNWRVFMHETEEEFTINVDYNNAMPQHDGLFWMLGMSALTNMELVPTVLTTYSEQNLVVYPNPTNGPVHIASDEPIRSITIHDINGKVIGEITAIDREKVTRNLLLNPGIYYLKIVHKTGITTKKLLIK